MAKISVMGTGSWGTALAILLHNNGHQVMLWSAHPEKAASLNQTREDPKKLPGIKIPDGIVITGDEKTALDSPDIVVFASPSAYMRAISKRLSPLIRRGQIIVRCLCAFRTKPCGRSKPRTPYYVCSQCPQKRDR